GEMNQLYTNSDGQNEKSQSCPVKPGSHRIKLSLGSGNIRVWADSKQLCYAKYPLPFTSGYLYFQMSSGANYPDRELYFDNITVTTVGTTQ
ncbi:MAG: hypothetical protein ACE5PV_18105, partial [Candidatus Poribacteria bacterium]